jgi:hypothetical protein
MVVAEEPKRDTSGAPRPAARRPAHAAVLALGVRLELDAGSGAERLDDWVGAEFLRRCVEGVLAVLPVGAGKPSFGWSTGSRFCDLGECALRPRR